MSTYSEQAAQWIASLKFSDLPADVIASTRLRVLDVIGLALAAVPTAVGKSVRAAALAMGSGNDARILGSGERVPAMQAALANGTMAQGFEYDDTHNETIIHISSPMVATALAVGEMVEASGGEIITSVAGGNELTCRIGLVAPQQFHKVGFHPTGVIGTLGAAYTASKLLGLNLEQMRNAVGIAGSQASGILACWENGTQSKFLHPGMGGSGRHRPRAARAPATPARHRCSKAALGCSYRTCRTKITSSIFRTCSRISAPPGKAATRRSNRTRTRTSCTRSSTRCCICIAEGLRAEQVEKIVCPIADYMIPVVCEPVAEKIAPASDSHGRVSLQYSLTEALVRGKLGVDGYSEESLRDPHILALARKVGYVVDKDAPGRGQYKGWVIVHTVGDRKLERVEPYNRGSTENPMPVDDICVKFRENAARVLDAKNIDAIITKVERLEQEATIAALIDFCVRQR